MNAHRLGLGSAPSSVRRPAAPRVRPVARPGITTQRHESAAFGRWSHRAWRPPQLADAVEKIWHSEGAMVYRGERLLPSGTAELLVIVGDPFRVTESEPRSFGGACLSGVLTGPLLIEQPERHSVVGVRLRPGAARRLLGLPLAELGSPVVSLDDVLGRAAARLAEQCHAAGSTEEIFRIVAGFVEHRLDRSRSYDPRVAWSTAQIEGSRGRVPIAQLRETVGLSRGRFATTFQENLSVSPKRYARLLRFRHATALLDAGIGSLGEVAQLAGYYDQPHMNGDFREFAGYPPHEFLARRYPSGVTAAEPS